MASQRDAAGDPGDGSAMIPPATVRTFQLLWEDAVGGFGDHFLEPQPEVWVLAVFCFVIKNFRGSAVQMTDDLGLACEKALWQSGSMSALSILPVNPDELRPLLHAEVDKLRGESLLLLHRVAMELELEEVTERLDAGFDEDRFAGKLARVPEIIREARAALRMDRLS